MNIPVLDRSNYLKGLLITAKLDKSLTDKEKEIIKVGGKRVSPKEIEEVILGISQVVDCTVGGIFDENLGEAIKASMVIDNSLNEHQIKDMILRRCKEKLALYKMPQIFEFNHKMTVKSTGKK